MRRVMKGYNRTAGLALLAFMLASPIANAASITIENPGATPIISDDVESDTLKSIQKFECIEDINGIKLARFEHTEEDKDSAWYKEKLKQYDAAIEALEGHNQQCEINTYDPTLPITPPPRREPS